MALQNVENNSIDFIKNFGLGLVSVESILKTLSNSSLDANKEVVLRAYASSIEHHFKTAEGKLDAIIDFFENKLCSLLESKEELVENTEELAQSIKDEERNIGEIQNQLAQSEKEKDLAVRKLVDTSEKLRDLERQEYSLLFKLTGREVATILIGHFLLGPVGGLLSVGINGVAFAAEIIPLKRKVAEYESHLKSHMDTISDLNSKMISAQIHKVVKEKKMFLLINKKIELGYELEQIKDNSNKISMFKETLKKFMNSISRIHIGSRVVSIACQEIYELKSLFNSLRELGASIEATFPGFGISSRLEALAIRADTFKMLDSEFSF